MSCLHSENKKFENLDSALLVVDVYFHRSYRPSGRFSDVKHYFSGKHYSYGLKIESAHYPNGLSAHVSSHHPDSTHDFAIFKDNVKQYKKLLTKTQHEISLPDTGLKVREFPH